jgi:ABC-type nickel/cobalt efflux system permease component RcnA
MLKPPSMKTGAAAALVLLALCAGALAQSSLGIGNNEVAVQPTGPFGEFFAWINSRQREFYRSMTGALKAMKDDGSAAWALAGLSFLYGVLHAAGPGHGKAVISSYMLANEVELRRGIALSFVSAFLQAITAIVMIGATYLILRGTAVSMTDATRFLEITSYALIMVFGLWLLWAKLRPVLVRAPQLAIAGAGHTHHRNHNHAHDHDHDQGHHHHAHSHHYHADSEVCETCGHAHAPDPAMLRGKFDWKAAFAAVAAVGMRPCSGALIVLSFAMLNGLVLGGIMSAFAMAAGTGLTVAVLATMAVMAKNAALSYSDGTAAAMRVQRTIEIAGAAFVALIGFILLRGALIA